MTNCDFYFLLKRALEEKKSARAELKNSEKMAMQSVQEKTATLEIYSKVLLFHFPSEQANARSLLVDANWLQQLLTVLLKCSIIKWNSDKSMAVPLFVMYGFLGDFSFLMFISNILDLFVCCYSLWG